MKSCAVLAVFLLTLCLGARLDAVISNVLPKRCIAFSPYVGTNDPEFGPHPAPEQIDALLDNLIANTQFRCILTYGVLNGLDYTFQAASARGLKVIAIIWLDTDPIINQASITKGIQSANDFTDTIIGISCGSEFRTRNGAFMDNVILDCIAQLRAASVIQPITSIDTWWEWCNRTSSCQPSSLASSVDWIGVNIFPWWENKFSGLYPCTTVAQSADFHIARLQSVKLQYPSKDVVITEFGWPAGPDNFTETNQFTGQPCVGAEAGESNQRRVIIETLSKLDTLGWRGIVFESFRQGIWKKRGEGDVGPLWGICAGAPPYECKQLRPIAPDFDGDGTSDIGIYRDGVWSILQSSNGVAPLVFLGGVAHIPVPSNYDGDGKADEAVYLDGVWNILRSSNGSNSIVGFGGPDFTAVPADYDGDGKADIAVYLNGVWSILRSSDGGNTLVGWGGPGFIPVPADYDGDGKADIAVYKDGVWSIVRSTDSGNTLVGHGGPTFTPVPADYDGDGKADIAVYLDGVWSIIRSTDSGNTIVGHGGPAFAPVPADYDGDGKADVGVYHTTGVWSILRSSDSGNTIVGHGGAPQDVPLN